MSERIVTMTVQVPIRTYRQLEASALRRRIKVAEFASQLLQGRVTPTVKTVQIEARRRAVAEFLELHYSITEIALRMGLDRNTVRHDVNIIRERQASA
jgi:DNA-binding NarL/FixJ family response regulator